MIGPDHYCPRCGEEYEQYHCCGHTAWEGLTGDMEPLFFVPNNPGRDT